MKQQKAAVPRTTNQKQTKSELGISAMPFSPAEPNTIKSVSTAVVEKE
jgi:hypothetical protein